MYYNVHKRRVQEWRKQKEEFEKIKNSKGLNIEQVRVLEGRGRKVAQPTLEKELLEYIKKRREEKSVVTTSIIIKKAKALGEVMNIKNTKFLHGWAECFKQRHKLVKCARTQIAQKIPEDMPLIIKDFLKTSREKTYTIEKKFIVSFDETPIWFNMPQNSTIDFKGTREVPVKTTANEKLQFTVVLGYIAARKKLPPVVIFKLKKTKRLIPA